MKIRKAKIKDSNRISYLIHKTTDRNLNKYSKEQILAWKKRNTPSRIRKQLEERIIFCAFKKNKLVGTIALKEEEILGFYVSPNFQRRGVGTKLLKHLENYSMKKGMSKLRLTSTPSALNFYKNKGFKPKKIIVLTAFGVEFPETEMEKSL